MNIRELYQDCLKYEEVTLAYYLYHLLQEQKISLEDDFARLDFDQADHEKVAQLIQQNPLGFKPIRIFSLKITKGKFVFIFAASRNEATDFFKLVFRRSPLNCHEYPLDFEIIRGNQVVTFREMRREYKRFPAVVGGCERRWKSQEK